MAFSLFVSLVLLFIARETFSEIMTKAEAVRQCRFNIQRAVVARRERNYDGSLKFFKQVHSFIVENDYGFYFRENGNKITKSALTRITWYKSLERAVENRDSELVEGFPKIYPLQVVFLSHGYYFDFALTTALVIAAIISPFIPIILGLG